MLSQVTEKNLLGCLPFVEELRHTNRIENGEIDLKFKIQDNKIVFCYKNITENLKLS